MTCSHHLKVDRCMIVPFWNIPGGQGMVNSPRTSNSAPCYSLCLGGEMARCVIIYPFMALANESVGYQGLGRHVIRKLVTKKFGEDVCK